MRADNPITRSEDDALGRSKPARSFAEQVLALDATGGIVVGVLGPWGSGKTSFINLAQGHLKESGVAVLEFNPWMFSGTDQLVQAFFIELSAQLKLRKDFAEIGKLIEDYGETFSGLGWLPLIGPWIERWRILAKVFARLLQTKKKGIRASLITVREALAKLDKPVVVIVDDIDRLSTAEIRDVFKLVRLTANFPNVIYLLAFDRSRVEQALSEQGIPGRDYLEKILQIGIDLPTVPEHLMSSQICQAIDGALAKVENPGYFDQDRWSDVFAEIVRPLIRNMRDVRRYAAGIHGTVRDLGGQIALVDVLALEAVRVFLPDVFTSIHSAIDGLTNTSKYSPKEQIEFLIKVSGKRDELVRNLVRQLFPAGERHLGGSNFGPEWKKQWLRERRVAHEDVLRLYLERIVGEGLQAFSYAETAWAKMADQTALANYLHSLPIEVLQDVVSSLEAYEEHFAPEHVVPATVVLLNLQSRILERQRGFFDVHPRTTVRRVVYRLLSSLKGHQAVEMAVRDILPQVKSLSSKIDLIAHVGYRNGVGHKLVSEAMAKSFEKEWRADVRAASEEFLTHEPDLLFTFLITKRDTEPGEAALIIPNSPGVTHAVLSSARTETRSQSYGSRAVSRTPCLSWESLIDVYGDESTLRDRIQALKVSQPENMGDLISLADKYLTGYRPNAFDDE